MAIRMEPTIFQFPHSRIYDFYTRVFFLKVYEQFARWIPVKNPRGKVLDVGAAAGYLGVALAKKHPELTVYSTDLSPDMVYLNKKVIKENKLAGRVIAQREDAYSLSFEDNTFDLVINSFTFHHWPNPKKMFAELHRVLKPGGEMFIIDGKKGFDYEDMKDFCRTVGFGLLGRLLARVMGKLVWIDFVSMEHAHRTLAISPFDKKTCEDAGVFMFLRGFKTEPEAS
ncbi:class I SAM-dependent methyltransferase [bacterium]|nr:class I SAM-dependent methyltransferase [bacterium]